MLATHEVAGIRMLVPEREEKGDKEIKNQNSGNSCVQLSIGDGMVPKLQG